MDYLCVRFSKCTFHTCIIPTSLLVGYSISPSPIITRLKKEKTSDFLHSTRGIKATPNVSHHLPKNCIIYPNTYHNAMSFQICQLPPNTFMCTSFLVTFHLSHIYDHISNLSCTTTCFSPVMWMPFS